jgi:hypothetical protein
MESGPQGLCRTKLVSKYFGYGWTTPSLPTIEIDNAPRTSTQNQANHARKSFNKLLEEKCGWLSRGIMLGRHSHPQSRKTGWSVKFGTGNQQRKEQCSAYEKGSELAKQNIERIVQTPSGGQRDVSGHGNL